MSREITDYDVFHALADDTRERDRPIIAAFVFVTCFL